MDTVGLVAGLILIEELIHRQIGCHILSVEVIGLIGLESGLGDRPGLPCPLQQGLLVLPRIQRLP